MLGLDKVDIDDIPTRSKNIALGIENRIFDGENQKLPGVDGTWWAAYNGFNEYLNYESGRSNSNRLGSLWLGKGAGNNIKALEIALAMAG